MNLSLDKIIAFAYGSITRKLYLHTAIVTFFLLFVISITIWAGNTLTMITAISRFERTHTVSRVEAMVALHNYHDTKMPEELKSFQSKMAITQSYNKVFSRLLDMRKDTPDAEFVRILETTFSETDHKTAEIIVNRIKVLYWHPILKVLVSNAAAANLEGEKIKVQAAQFIAASNEAERAAILSNIDKIGKEFTSLEIGFSKSCSELSNQISSYVNFFTIALLFISVGFTGFLTYMIARTIVRQAKKYTSDLEKEIQVRKLTEQTLIENNLLLKSVQAKLQYQNEELQVNEEELRSQNDQLHSTEEMLRVQINEYEASQKLLKEREESLQRQNNLFSSLLEILPVGVFMVEAPSGKPLLANEAAYNLLGRGILPDASKENLSNIYKAYKAGTRDPYPPEEMPIILGMSGVTSHIDDMEVERPDGTKTLLEIYGAPVTGEKGDIWASLVSFTDITDRKRAEEAIKKRILSLTLPMESGVISFEELFNIDDVQRLQDDFAKATGVASIITDLDGIPLTAPSNFTRLCNDLIRKTEKGCANCFKSDAALGRYNPHGPNIQQCLSGGLCDAGAGITVGGKHIANWLIGQVRDETQTDEKMAAYAREIGVEEATFMEAFREVPSMSLAQFEHVAQALFTLANQLSTSAYQNIQQARFINDRKQAEEALRKSEETFRMIFTNAAIGLMLADSQCVAIDCNQHFADIFGTSRQDYAGMNLLTTIPEGPVRQHFLDTLADNSVHRYEGPYTSKVTGRELYLTITSQQTTSNHVIIIINDITERRQAEKGLQITRVMVEHASDALFWISPDARIVDANEAACRSLGYSKDELLQLSVPDLDVYYNADTWPEHFAELRRSGSLKFESMQRVRDGRLFPVEIVANYIQFDDMEFNCAFVRDISERKKSEEQLTSMTQRLQLATSSAHLGIWDWNVKDNSMVWDDRMFELYGITRETFPNSIDAWMSGLHPEDKEAAIAECQSALNGEKVFDTEFRVLHPEGTVKYIRGKGLVLRGKDGKAERMLGINYDITKTKRAEEEKHKLEFQLLQAQKMESVGRLAGGVAHDFNNMLGVILGHAELGLMHLDPTNPVCADLKEISKTAERSADLTRQLLAFARKQTVSPKVIDLNDTVTNMLKMLQRLIGEHIKLVWQPSHDQCQVKIDPSQIDQILANLCVNARDAIADTGRITIETGTCSIDADYCTGNPEATPGDYVRLVVSDDGRGMDRETLTHIFEPFYTTKEMGKGTGLGLATVYGAVKQNNGFINIYSEPGKGTTFSIHLPHYAEDMVRKQTEGDSQAVPRGQETILLVEDEAAILNITAIMLEKQGYTVLKADSPGRAMELAHEHHGAIHLLMTDVIMPEMNGRDLARNILALHPGMKRLFMSGYTADVIAHHGVLDDGVHFIQKPFSLPNMAAKVREVLDKP